MAIVLGMVLPWLLIAAGIWLGYQLLRQNGLNRLRLESIEKQLNLCAGAQRQEAGALPVGMAAPDFELADLTRIRRRLSEFGGKTMLLIFFNSR